MIKLIVLTGFLGAGKTTFLKCLIEEYRDEKIGVIINEFGAISVDSELIKEDGLDMMELSNGSIFCACIKDKFVESLIKMSSKDINYLFIEASGLADPANMPDILRGIEHMLHKPLQFTHSLCIVDGQGFVELSEILVALKKQVAYSDLIIVNKADLIDDSRFREICEIIGGINSHALVYKTTYCDVNIKELIESPCGLTGMWEESSNTPEVRPQTFVLKGVDSIDEKELKAFLSEIKGSTYRIKGFLKGTEGPLEISCVGEQMEVRPWKYEIDDGRLVVISSVGIQIISTVYEAIERCAKGKISL